MYIILSEEGKQIDTLRTEASNGPTKPVPDKYKAPVECRSAEESPVPVPVCPLYYFHTDYPVTKTGPPRSDAGHCPAVDKSTTPY